VNEPRAVVLRFLKDWEDGFLGAFERWMHPDAGRAEVLHIACDGGTVLTERIDHLWGETGQRHSAPIMGAFEVKVGLIWRYSDYFDASQFKPEEFLEEAG
jgi:limonene-1,2-epoxide hydrolase